MWQQWVGILLFSEKSHGKQETEGNDCESTSEEKWAQQICGIFEEVWMCRQDNVYKSDRYDKSCVYSCTYSTKQKKRNSTRDVILGNTAKRKRIRYRFGIPSKSLSGFRSTRGRGIANPFLFIVQELRLLLQFITANALSEISTFYPWNQLCSGCICVVLDTAEFYRRNKSVLFRDGRCG